MEPHYRITVIFQTGSDCQEEAKLKGVAKRTLQLEGIKNDIEINLLFTDDKGIKKLNQKFLGRNEPTDVISFGVKKGRPVKKDLRGFIGEVAISVETAECNAKRFNTTKEREIFLYIIHGILHLLGYEDKGKKEKKAIWDRQDKILEAVCQENS